MIFLSFYELDSILNAEKKKIINSYVYLLQEFFLLLIFLYWRQISSSNKCFYLNVSSYTRICKFSD